MAKEQELSYIYIVFYHIYFTVIVIQKNEQGDAI